MERVGGIALSEEDGATVERGLGAASSQPPQVAVGEGRKDGNVSQLVRRHARRGRPWVRRHRRLLLAALDVILAEILVDEGDGDRSFAHAGGDALDRRVANVAGGENARNIRLQHQWLALQWPTLHAAS